MPYQLGPDVSCCRYDGHFIFLDTHRDQYFRLSNAVECAFATYIETSDEAAIIPLVDKGVLTYVPDPEPRPTITEAEPPIRSAMEEFSNGESPSITTHLDVLAIVSWTHWQLATRNLSDVLSGLSAYRNRKAPSARSTPMQLDVQSFVRAACAFNRARVYVPIVPRCLPDAISMVRFLAKRGFHANVVFGVAGNPFAAHAWVQVADLILSDSVGNVAAHTPIRVV